MTNLHISRMNRS